MTRPRFSRYSIVLDTVGPLKPDSRTRSAREHGLFARSSRYNSRALIWRRLVGRDDSSAGILALCLGTLLLAKQFLPGPSAKRDLRTITEDLQTVFRTSQNGDP